MNTRRIIKELYGKAFDQSYVDTLKAAYKADVEEGLFTAEEADYSKAVPYLEEHLSSEQKEILKAIEQRYENRWGYATQYPFVYGLMHAFEQFFFLRIFQKWKFGGVDTADFYFTLYHRFTSLSYF